MLRVVLALSLAAVGFSGRASTSGSGAPLTSGAVSEIQVPESSDADEIKAFGIAENIKNDDNPDGEDASRELPDRLLSLLERNDESELRRRWWLAKSSLRDSLVDGLDDGKTLAL